VIVISRTALLPLLSLLLLLLLLLVLVVVACMQLPRLQRTASPHPPRQRHAVSPRRPPVCPPGQRGTAIDVNNHSPQRETAIPSPRTRITGNAPTPMIRTRTRI